MVLINDKWCVHGCSSQYALRSYLYLLFHEVVGRPASWLFSEDKVSFLLCLVVELNCLRWNVEMFMLFMLPLSFLAVGESVLCCEILSGSSLCYN